MRFVVIARKGKITRRTRENDQPLVNAKVNPATHMEKARMIVPIFSPRALCMAEDSLASLAESSDGLMVSNHADSYLRMASRYLTLVVFTTRSEKSNRKEYMTREKIHTAIPTSVKMSDI